MELSEELLLREAAHLAEEEGGQDLPPSSLFPSNRPTTAPCTPADREDGLLSTPLDGQACLHDVKRLGWEVERWLELTTEEQHAVMQQVQDSQKKIAEHIRMSQALVHFQADEAYRTLQNAAEARFLQELQQRDREFLAARLEAGQATKARRLREKLKAKRMRQMEKLREREYENLLKINHLSTIFRQRSDFQRRQHSEQVAQTIDRHQKEAKELVQAQEMEARHLKMAQELNAKNLPPHLQEMYMQICGIAARHLRHAQATRARHLAELQALELSHSGANFERAAKMASDRHEMELMQFKAEQNLLGKQATELVEETLRIRERRAELRALQEKELALAEEKQLRAQQRAKALHQELSQRKQERRRRALWRQNAVHSYAEFLGALGRDENVVSKVFSEDGSSSGGSGSVTSTATAATEKSQEEFEQKLRRLRMQEEREAQERSRRDDAERQAIIDNQKKELEEVIAEDTKRIQALKQRHTEQLESMRGWHAAERAKLVKKWRDMETSVRAEQDQSLSIMRFKHASLITELEESQARELDQFKRLYELQAQLQGAETRGKLDTVSFICHEVRNPLAGVCGMVDLLLEQYGTEQPLTSEQEKLLMAIRNETDLMIAILNDVLDLGRLEAGKLEIEAREFDPYLVLANVVEARRAGMQSQGKPVDIVLRTEGQAVHSFVSDEIRYRQIANNIIGNACKFTSSGTVTVTLEMVEVGPQRALRSIVQDTGCGIPKEAMEKLFVPFSQAKVSVARKYGGSGLGLSICRLLVDRLGGTLEVTSQAGKGSTFWWDLPILPLGDADRLTEGTEQDGPGRSAHKGNEAGAGSTPERRPDGSAGAASRPSPGGKEGRASFPSSAINHVGTYRRSLDRQKGLVASVSAANDVHSSSRRASNMTTSGPNLPAQVGGTLSIGQHMGSPDAGPQIAPNTMALAGLEITGTPTPTEDVHHVHWRIGECHEDAASSSLSSGEPRGVPDVTATQPSNCPPSYTNGAAVEQLAPADSVLLSEMIAPANAQLVPTSGVHHLSISRQASATVKDGEGVPGGGLTGGWPSEPLMMVPACSTAVEFLSPTAGSTGGSDLLFEFQSQGSSRSLKRALMPLATPMRHRTLTALPAGLRVLIAEDSATLQKLYSMNFQKEGIKPVLAKDGQEALELAERHAFDVMLLDVLMPVMNGDQALLQMRQKGILTPALMVTANALPQQREAYLRAGAFDVVLKPWTFAKLRATIVETLNSYEAEAAKAARRK